MNRMPRMITMAIAAALLCWAGVAGASQAETQKKGTAPPRPGTAKEGVHSHEMAMRHGGQVAMTKQHHFETVFLPSGVEVYLYTAEQAPMMAEKATGTVTFKFKDGKTKTLPMAIAAPKEGEQAVYFCPMHPKVVQMEPGVCKLCGGMKLYRQDRLAASIDLSKVEPGAVEATFDIAGLAGPEPTAKFTMPYAKPVMSKEGTAPERKVTGKEAMKSGTN